MLIEDRLLKDWSIFSGSSCEVKQIVSEYVSESLDLESKIAMERVGMCVPPYKKYVRRIEFILNMYELFDNIFD